MGEFKEEEITSSNFTLWILPVRETGNSVRARVDLVLAGGVYVRQIVCRHEPVLFLEQFY